MLKIPFKNEEHAQDEAPRDKTKGRPGESGKKGAYIRGIYMDDIALPHAHLRIIVIASHTVSHDANETKRDGEGTLSSTKRVLDLGCVRSVIWPLPPYD